MAPRPIVDVKPSYTVDNALDYTSGPRTGIASNTIGPTREHVANLQSVGDMNCAPIHAVGDEAGQGGSGGVRRLRPRWDDWVGFVTGHLVSVMIVASLTAKFNRACFDEQIYARSNDEDAAGDEQETLEGTEPSQQTEDPTQDIIFDAIICGLVIQIYFAVVFSVVYRSPLDIKSVHKIPPEALLSTAQTLNVCTLAPLSWALIYLLGGVASLNSFYESNCERHGGVGLDIYLITSGMFMVDIGVFFLPITIWGLVISLRRYNVSTQPSGDEMREFLSQYFLAKGLYLDVFWRLQTMVLAYHTGKLGLAVSVLFGIHSTVGVRYTAVRSVTPDMFHRSPEEGSPASFAIGV